MPLDLKSMSREDKIKLATQMRDKIELLKQQIELKKARQLATAYENNPTPATIGQQRGVFEKITDPGYLAGKAQDFLAGVAQGGKNIARITGFEVMEKGIDKLRQEHEGLPGFGAGEQVGNIAEGVAVYAPIAAGVAATGGAGTLAAPFLAGVATGAMKDPTNPAGMLANAAMFTGTEAGIGALGKGVKQVQVAKRAGRIREARAEAYTRLFDEVDAKATAKQKFIDEHSGGLPVRSDELSGQGGFLKKRVGGKVRATTPKSEELVKREQVANEALETMSKQVKAGESTELAAFGLSPKIMSETATSIDNIARSVGGAITPNALKSARSSVKSKLSQQTLADIGAIEEKAAVNVIGPATEALRKAGLYKFRNRIFTSNLKAIANDLRNNVPSKFRDVLEYVHTQAKEAGIAIGHRVGYYPQILSQKYSDSFLNDFHPILQKIRQGEVITDSYVKKAMAERTQKGIISKESTQLVEHLVKDKKLTYSDAVEYLYGEAQPGALPSSRFAKNRLITLGEQFTENNAAVALTKYVESMGRYIEQTKTWGKDGKILTERLNKLRDESPFEHARVSELLDVYNGYKYSDYWSSKGIKTRQFWQNYSAFTYLTKIGMGLSTIPQTMQTFGTTAARAGYLRTATAYFRALASPTARGQARAIGLTNPDLMAVFGGYHPAGSLATAADIAATVNQFKGVNRLNLYTSALAAEGAIKKWHSLASKSGESASQIWARNNLKRVGMDWSKPLTDDVLKQKMYRLAVDSQLMKNIVDEPAFLNDPSMGKWLLLKRFGVKQAQAMKQIILDDAVLKNSEGRVVGYNPLPAARLALFGYGSGEAILWARNVIKEGLSGKPQYRKEDIDTSERILDDFAMSGAFGIISDVSGLFDVAGDSKLAAAENKLLFTFAPTLAIDAKNIIESNISLARYWRKHDDASLALKKNMSQIAQPFGSIVSQMAQRTKTAGQQRSEVETLRGAERSAILDLFIAGDVDKGLYRLSQFNDNYPEFSFTPEDINYKAMKNRVKTQLENTIKEGID